MTLRNPEIFAIVGRIITAVDPGFWKGGGGPTMKDSEMSRQSRRGDAEGIVEGECERGLNPLAGESGGIPVTT